MPFLKFRSSGRRVPRGSRRRQRGHARRTLRRKLMTSGKVKRIIDAELKVRDLGVGPIIIPSVTGDITHITSIGQGDLSTQRTGNWIKPVSWMGTFTVQGDVAAADDTSQFRIGCFVWKENQSTDPATLAKIVQDTSAPHQQYNIESKGSFKILWSRTGLVSNNNRNPQFQKIYRFYVKPSMKILYDGSAFRKFHLFIFGMSNADPLDNPPIYSFDTRLRFTDS